MKIVCDQSELAGALGLATQTIPERGTNPALQCAMVSVSRNNIEVVTSSVDVSLRVDIKSADIGAEGAVLIPAKKLADTVRSIVADRIDISSEGRRATVSGGGAKFKIDCEDVANFPEVPTWDGTGGFVVVPDKLRSMLEKTAFAAGDESRYALDGVFFDIKPERMRLVATDGNRLALNEIATPSGAVDVACVVPRVANRVLGNILAGETAALRFGEGKVYARCGNATLVALLAASAFPPYEAVILKAEQPHKISVATDALLTAVKQAALFANDKSDVIAFALEFGRLTLMSRSHDIGESEVIVPVEYSGSSGRIGFQSRFIIDALKVIQAAKVDFAFGEPERPAVIRDGDGMTYIVMPFDLG